MNRTIGLRTAFATAMAVAMLLSSGIALANRGGGGDNGDNSMNPFTGDSYAYFHGGHNLGEQGTIRPDRAPPRPWYMWRRDPNASSAPAATPNAGDVERDKTGRQSPKSKTSG